MKQADVHIGGTYRVKIGDRLAEVVVLRRLDGRGRARYECRTADTGRTIRATAARLRPCEKTPAVAPVPPTAIPGVRLNAGRLIEPMQRFNAGGIVRFTDRQHVAMSVLAVCRAFVRSVNRRSLRDFPVAFRRGTIHCILAHHTFNQGQYRQVMGRVPLPSEETVTAAMLGDEAARAAVLA
jgi:hypothetical protein